MLYTQCVPTYIYYSTYLRPRNRAKWHNPKLYNHIAINSCKKSIPTESYRI